MEVVLHMRFLLLGQQSLPLFFFFKITCGRKPIIFIRILCLCVYNFPVISRCKLVRNKACLSFTGANSFNFFFNNMSPKTMHQLMKIFTLKGSEYHSGILSKFPKWGQSWKIVLFKLFSSLGFIPHKICKHTIFIASCNLHAFPSLENV